MTTGTNTARKPKAKAGKLPSHRKGQFKQFGAKTPIIKRPALKNKLRGLERLIKKGDLQGEALEAKQKEIDDIKAQLDGRKTSEVEKKFSQKYHMVKFFERVKVERKFKKCQKDLENEDLGKKERKALEQKRDQLMADLDYVMFYPKDKKYVALFANSNPQHIAAMRALVTERKAAELAAELAAQEANAPIVEKDEVEPAADLEATDDFFMGMDEHAEEDDEVEAKARSLIQRDEKVAKVREEREVARKLAARAAESSDEDDLFAKPAKKRASASGEAGAATSEGSHKKAKPSKREEPQKVAPKKIKVTPGKVPPKSEVAPKWQDKQQSARKAKPKAVHQVFEQSDDDSSDGI